MAGTVQRKRPETDFVVRLVGSNIRPWAVPMRSLARVLEAVQRLIDQKDEGEDRGVEGQESQADSGRLLHLVDVKSKSAGYAVSSPNRDIVRRALEAVREQIN